jgi:AcrR family transcriptional regulator
MSGADLQRTVLDASVALIHERGVSALSMREVARRAGVSHQAPYHHFGDREGILAAIAVEGFTALREGMVKSIAAIGDPADRLTAVGGSYVDFALRNPAHFQLMFRSDVVDPSRHPALKRCADAAFDLLVAVVSEVVEARGRGQPLPLAVAAWALAHGLATLTIEGKLQRRLGKGRRRQREGVSAALEAFRALLP